MKTLRYLLCVVLITLFVSCGETTKTSSANALLVADTNKSNKDNALATSDTIRQISNVDTLIRQTAKVDTADYSYYHDSISFETDDYPVTDNMLRRFFKLNPDGQKSLDKSISPYAWFSNDTLKQSLLFNLGTDYYRTEMFDFFNADIPKDMIDKMELGPDMEDIYSEVSKIQVLPGFIHKAKKINQSYFISDKGFRLGDSLKTILAVYGKPDSIRIEEDSIIKYDWDFAGPAFSNKGYIKGEREHKNGWGNQTMMYFRKSRLIAVDIENYMP
jgi:hypothetical protein